MRYMNIYVELTHQFNTGKIRSILSSGQAVVLHRLAIMSKDGDWILKEDTETMEYILKVLAGYGAQYRFGAPMDIRWLSGGWSSHLEFYYNKLRIRTDFCTRPPRVSASALKKLWDEQEKKEIPFVDIKTLAEIKKTNREKDYAVIGELARLMSEPKDQLLYSRSARDLIRIARKNPEVVSELVKTRPVLKEIPEGIKKLESALDAERRMLIHANEKRLKKYMKASLSWQATWPQIQKETVGLSLTEIHKILVSRASGVLPFSIKGI